MGLVSENFLLRRRRAVAAVVVEPVGKWSDLFLSTYPQAGIPILGVKILPGGTYNVTNATSTGAVNFTLNFEYQGDRASQPADRRLQALAGSRPDSAMA